MKKIILSIFTSIILSVTSFSAFAKTEVVWWDLLGGGDGVRMASLIEAFERDNPDIDIVNSTLEWGPPYYAKLQTSAAIGEQPDIAIYHISRYQMAKGTNIFSPISIDELASVGITADQYYDAFWNKAKADDDGYLYGLPFDGPLYVMHVNLDMLEEAGLLDENGHPTGLNGDFDTFFAAMEKLQAITGDTPPLSYTASSQYTIYWWMLSIIKQIGGEIWTEDGGYCPGNECEIAMQFLADLVDKGYVNRNADGATEQGNFVSGKSAIYIDGGWNVPTHVDMTRKNELPFKYGVFKVPQLGPKMAAMLHGHTLVIPHSDVSPISDEKRAAVLRIMGWFSKNSLYWATAGHYIPHKPTAESPFYQNMWPNSGYADVGEVGFFEPNHPIFGIAGPTYDVMGNWFPGGVNGDISVEEAIQGAREEIESMM